MSAHRNQFGLAGAGARRGRSALAAFLASLSGRLLGLTIVFVLVAEVLILAPSLVMYQRAWLREHANRAGAAADALLAADVDIEADLAREVLAATGVLAVRLRTAEGAIDIGERAAQPRALDPEALSLGGSLRAVAATLAAPPGRVLRIHAGTNGRRLEVDVAEAGLTRELRAFAQRVLLGSVFISLITAALVYATLLRLLVGPMRALTKRIERFAARPHDASATTPPSGRSDEIGRAETALAAMEEELRAALRQRERLAGLGAAIARIAHDMRGSLATAQLVSERLASVADPTVRQVVPRLERAIARAGALAEAAMRYGKAEEPQPQIAPVELRAALEDAAAEAIAGHAVVWRNAAPAGLFVMADPDQLHRVLGNLIRNAAQALAAQDRAGVPGTVAATATVVGASALLRVVDDGPGLPEAVRERLFEPFAASGGRGAGLGLAIARELTRAQGGEVRLVATSPQGTAFEVELSLAPAAGAVGA